MKLLYTARRIFKHMRITQKSFPAALFALAVFGSCYYDKEEVLYPGTGSCDTANVKYSTTVNSILSQNCFSCHSGGSPSGNISMDNYTAVKFYVDNGRLVGAIKHLSGFRAMPDGGGKLTDCQIKQIDAWIRAGALNN